MRSLHFGSAGLGGGELALAEVGTGQLVVVGRANPWLHLWKGQAYEVVRIYYKRLGGGFSNDCVEVPTFGTPMPAGSRMGEGDVWELWCDLHNKRYHASPVHCKPEDVHLHSFGGELQSVGSNVVKDAVPLSFFGGFVWYWLVFHVGPLPSLANIIDHVGTHAQV
jgi:hypothetical protein